MQQMHNGIKQNKPQGQTVQMNSGKFVKGQSGRNKKANADQRKPGENKRIFAGRTRIRKYFSKNNSDDEWEVQSKDQVNRRPAVYSKDGQNDEAKSRQCSSVQDFEILFT